MRKILVLLFSCPYLSMRQQKHNIKNIKHLFQKILNMFMCEAHTPLSIGEGLGVRSLTSFMSSIIPIDVKRTKGLGVRSLSETHTPLSIRNSTGGRFVSTISSIDVERTKGFGVRLIRKAVTFFAMLLIVVTSNSQEPLHIGMTVPDVQLDSMVNYSTPAARLSDLKNKIIILDFFATWCSSCKTHLPAMDSLQRKYQNQLQVLMVSSINTKDDTRRVNKMIAAYNSQHALPLSIPAVVKDTALLALFPHKYIPHYVWLDEQLTVIAITSGAFIKDDVVAAMLQQTTTIKH